MSAPTDTLPAFWAPILQALQAALKNAGKDLGEVEYIDEDESGLDGGQLCLLYGRAFLAVEKGMYLLDRGIDISDPSVGLFGFEPAFVPSAFTKVDDVAAKLLDILGEIEQDAMCDACCLDF